MLLPFANGAIPLPTELSALANLGVAGALIYVIVLLQKEKREMRVSQDAMETTRHADSDKLNDTLRDMTRHCAESIPKRNAE